MAWIEKDHNDHLVSTPLLRAGLPADQAAQSHIHTWAVQGGGGVTDPGGVQGTFGRCVEGHGLVRTIGDL